MYADGGSLAALVRLRCDLLSRSFLLLLGEGTEPFLRLSLPPPLPLLSPSRSWLPVWLWRLRDLEDEEGSDAPRPGAAVPSCCVFSSPRRRCSRCRSLERPLLPRCSRRDRPLRSASPRCRWVPPPEDEHGLPPPLPPPGAPLPNNPSDWELTSSYSSTSVLNPPLPRRFSASWVPPPPPPRPRRRLCREPERRLPRGRFRSPPSPQQEEAPVAARKSRDCGGSGGCSSGGCRSGGCSNGNSSGCGAGGGGCGWAAKRFRLRWCSRFLSAAASTAVLPPPPLPQPRLPPLPPAAASEVLGIELAHGRGRGPGNPPPPSRSGRHGDPAAPRTRTGTDTRGPRRGLARSRTARLTWGRTNTYGLGLRPGLGALPDAAAPAERHRQRPTGRRGLSRKTEVSPGGGGSSSLHSGPRAPPRRDTGTGRGPPPLLPLAAPGRAAGSGQAGPPPGEVSGALRGSDPGSPGQRAHTCRGRSRAAGAQERSGGLSAAARG